MVVEVRDHPALLIKSTSHPFRLGRNRVQLESTILAAVNDVTGGTGATAVFRFGTDPSGYSWLVRERVFDVEPRGDQQSRDRLIQEIFKIHPTADLNRLMLPDPTFDNVRWGSPESSPKPRGVLIEP